MSSGDAHPADMERTKGVQDVSVLWDAASHTAMASRSGFKVIKWVAVPTGMAQRSFQGLLACPAWTSLPVAGG